MDKNNKSSASCTRIGFFGRINEIIQNSDLCEQEKSRFFLQLVKARSQHLGVAIMGSTGAGKTTTINALSGKDVGKIGTGTMPETDRIVEYELDGITIYDTPGFGDGVEADKRHAEEISELLRRVDENNKAVVDIVLIIVDGSSRDIGTVVRLINHILIHHFKDEPERIIIAINKADRGIQVGSHFDYENTKPDEVLSRRMDEMAETIRQRVKESTGIDVNLPIWYVAGGKEEGKEKYPSYNISKLLNAMVSVTPNEKRAAWVGNISDVEEDFIYDDGAINYNQQTAAQIWDSTLGCAATAAGIGALLGSFAGPVGSAIGAGVGAGVAIIVRGFCSIFS
ncbi:MAG: 50S ribosome-binding GTPase [Lachnospiraceae bacterium]|nr:50S ribosome-binding GTPase [Lachnospiraceae bacterium]